MRLAGHGKIGIYIQRGRQAGGQREPRHGPTLWIVQGIGRGLRPVPRASQEIAVTFFTALTTHRQALITTYEGYGFAYA